MIKYQVSKVSNVKNELSDIIYYSKMIKYY